MGVFYLILGGAAFVALVVFLPWFFMRPKTAKLPRELIDQLNRYEEEFQRFNANVVVLDKLLRGEARHQWQSHNSEIVRTLRKINRLLQKLNDFYEALTLTQYRLQLRQKLERMGHGRAAGEFLTAEEKARFRKLGKFSDKEINNVNWDEILRRL
jgi:hypothetical protein